MLPRMSPGPGGESSTASGQCPSARASPADRGEAPIVPAGGPRAAVVSSATGCASPLRLLVLLLPQLCDLGLEEDRVAIDRLVRLVPADIAAAIVRPGFVDAAPV